MSQSGTTGSGKTTALRQLLDGIEARGEAALCYDTSGEFVAHYYRPGRGDIILNPFDARCAYWTPFSEIAHPADAARIAPQFVTETGQHDNDVRSDERRVGEECVGTFRYRWSRDPTEKNTNNTQQ